MPRPDQSNCTNAPNDPGHRNLNGDAFLAQDATALGKSLQTIFKYIKEKSFSFTAPTVPSVRLADTEKVYITSFAPNATPFWRGDLKAYALSPNGTLPVGGDGFPSESPVWEASALLGNTNPDVRKIYTAKGGSRIDFTTANILPEDLGLRPTETVARNALINHVRGTDAYDTNEDNQTTDWRKWRLGDIFSYRLPFACILSRTFQISDPASVIPDC